MMIANLPRAAVSGAVLDPPGTPKSGSRDERDRAGRWEPGPRRPTAWSPDRAFRFLADPAPRHSRWPRSAAVPRETARFSALYLDPPAMSQHHLSRHGQAKPAPALGRSGRKERLEDPVLNVVRHAASIVDDVHPDLFALPTCQHPDRPTRPDRTGGIVQQCLEGPLQPRPAPTGPAAGCPSCMTPPGQAPARRCSRTAACSTLLQPPPGSVGGTSSPPCRALPKRFRSPFHFLADLAERADEFVADRVVPGISLALSDASSFFPRSPCRASSLDAARASGASSPSAKQTAKWPNASNFPAFETACPTSPAWQRRSALPLHPQPTRGIPFGHRIKQDAHRTSSTAAVPGSDGAACRTNASAGSTPEPIARICRVMA